MCRAYRYDLSVLTGPCRYVTVNAIATWRPFGAQNLADCDSCWQSTEVKLSLNVHLMLVWNRSKRFLSSIQIEKKVAGLGR